MILDDIVLKTKMRIDIEKKLIPLEIIKSEALKMNLETGFPFEKALRKDKINFICEIKKASPSKGIISIDFPYLEIAKKYEEANASAISVLTEPYFFMGSDKYLNEISREVKIPILRKDFTIDPYMIYQAKILGASAILLICAILDADQLSLYLALADSLGLSSLVEVHDIDELNMALRAKARIIGVNNRDLKTFIVDINNSVNLRKMVPDNIIFVSESGIRNKTDIDNLKDNRVNAVLIGETLMKSKDIIFEINKLRGL